MSSVTRLSCSSASWIGATASANDGLRRVDARDAHRLAGVEQVLDDHHRVVPLLHRLAVEVLRELRERLAVVVDRDRDVLLRGRHLAADLVVERVREVGHGRHSNRRPDGRPGCSAGRAGVRVGATCPRSPLPSGALATTRPRPSRFRAGRRRRAAARRHGAAAARRGERGAAPVRRLPRRPGVPLGARADRELRPRAAGGRDRRALDRELVGRRAAAGRAAPPIRFAPEYRLGDVDELVRNAEQRGMEVLLTIWGTPALGQRRRAAERRADRSAATCATSPTRSRRATRAVIPATRSSASTRSGTSRTRGSSSRRSSTPPAARSRRASTPRSSRRPTRGSRARARRRSSPPARPARAGATSRARTCRTPSRPRASPGSSRRPRRACASTPGRTTRTRATTSRIPTRRRPGPRSASPGSAASTARSRAGSAVASVPLWVTEVAYRTSPEIPGAAPYPLQAAYLARVLELARAQPGVRMLVWFVFRDEPGEPWQSGLLDHRGRAKPSLARFAAASLPTARDLQVQADPASLVHDFPVPALELRSHLDPGARLGVRYSLAACGKSVAGGMTATRMGADGWVPVTTQLPLRARARPTGSTCGSRTRTASRCGGSCRSRRPARARRRGRSPRPAAEPPRRIERAMARPVVGITTYVVEARFGAWETDSALVPADYVRAIERAGGRPLLVPPSTDGVEETLDALDGLVFSGGSDIDPELYDDEPHPETTDVARGARRRRARAAAGGARARHAGARDLPRLAAPERRPAAATSSSTCPRRSATTGTRRLRHVLRPRRRDRARARCCTSSWASTRRSSRTTTRASAAWATGLRVVGARRGRLARGARGAGPRGSRSACSGTPRRARTRGCSRRSSPGGESARA